MASLFIDTTYDITLGVLDDDLGWINFQTYKGQKASAIIQKETHNLLNQAHLKFSDLNSVITLAGPGFYTGLRLSEGFADVALFSGLKHYSFLAYDIPKLVGTASYIWTTKAYRGEYFFHFAKDGQSHNELIASKELETYLKHVEKLPFYIHSDSAIDDLTRQLVTNPQTTLEILQKNPKPIFKYILENNLKVDSFYFRAPEDEFKASV